MVGQCHEPGSDLGHYGVMANLGTQQPELRGPAPTRHGLYRVMEHLVGRSCPAPDALKRIAPLRCVLGTDPHVALDLTAANPTERATYEVGGAGQ